MSFFKKLRFYQRLSIAMVIAQFITPFSSISCADNAKKINESSLSQNDPARLRSLFKKRLKKRTENLNFNKHACFVDLNEKDIEIYVKEVLNPPQSPHEYLECSFIGAKKLTRFNTFEYCLLEKAGLCDASQVRISYRNFSPTAQEELLQELEDEKNSTAIDLRIFSGNKEDGNRSILSILQSYCETDLGQHWITNNLKFNNDIAKTEKLQAILKELVTNDKLFNAVSFKLQNLSSYYKTFINNLNNDQNETLIVRLPKDLPLATKIIKNLIDKIIPALQSSSPGPKLKILLPIIFGKKYGKKIYDTSLDFIEEFWFIEVLRRLITDGKSLFDCKDIFLRTPTPSKTCQELTKEQREKLDNARDRYKPHFQEYINLYNQYYQKNNVLEKAEDSSNKFQKFLDIVQTGYFKFLCADPKMALIKRIMQNQDQNSLKTLPKFMDLGYFLGNAYLNYYPYSNVSFWENAKKGQSQAIQCQKFLNIMLSLGDTWGNNDVLTKNCSHFKGLHRTCKALKGIPDAEKEIQEIKKNFLKLAKDLHIKCRKFEQTNKNKDNICEEGSGILKECFNLKNTDIENFAKEIRTRLESDEFREASNSITFAKLKQTVKKLNDPIFSKKSPTAFDIKHLGFGHLFKANKVLRDLESCNLMLQPALISLAEIDGLVGIATMIRQQKKKGNKFCFVSFAKDAEKPYIKLESAWNPLAKGNNVIDLCAAIPSDFEIGTSDAKHALITGPNGEGKSTAIRSVACCVWLGQSFGIAPARSAIFSPIDNICSIPKDAESTSKGLSSHTGQLYRVSKLMKEVAIANNNGKKTLVFADELFNGTNSTDSAGLIIAAVKSISESAPSSCWLISSHSEKAHLIEQATSKLLKNVKVHERKLYTGISKISSNEKLLNQMQFSKDFINEYKAYKNDF